MQVFIGEWLKDSQYDVLNKASASNPDIVEAIFSLIEEWKSNKEVLEIDINMFDYLLLTSFVFIYVAHQQAMPSFLWLLQNRIQVVYTAIPS